MPEDPAAGGKGPAALETLFVSHLAFIDEVTASICRRRGLAGADAEDFASAVKLKLIRNDYAVLAAFDGGSTLETYLTAVIQRAFIDHRRRAGHRWRPSRRAERLGPAAIRLEELRDRHGRSFDEICEILIANEHLGVTRRELEEIDRALRRRAVRRHEGPEAFETMASREPRPDEKLLDAERATAGERARRELRAALAELPLEDRMVLKLRDAGVTIREIAEQMGVKPMRLYRRLPRVRRRLKKALEARGVRPEELF